MEENSKLYNISQPDEKDAEGLQELRSGFAQAAHVAHRFKREEAKEELLALS